MTVMCVIFISIVPRIRQAVLMVVPISCLNWRTHKRMASLERSEKLRVLLIPFFATSHIGPFTDLAVRLASARPDVVKPTIAVTVANVSVVRSALNRHGSTASSAVSIATYPFPEAAGLAQGVENLSTAGVDGWRIDAAATNETLTRPAQEALIRDQSPDALITDEIIVAGFPGSELRIPKSELPDYMITRQRNDPDGFNPDKIPEGQKRCHGVVVNTFLGLEKTYYDKFVHDGFAKRAYLVGPLCLPQTQVEACTDKPPCISWLDSKPSRSVVYICFGTFAPVSEKQLDELALGLEASEKPFLWVVRADRWAPPAGWEERIGKTGLLARDWVPQTAILAHPATAAFLTHCGWNSVLEGIIAGMPLLTWPLVFEQFISERLVIEVLRIGERVWDGPRSVQYKEAAAVPAAVVARAVARFLEPGGTGDTARVRAQELGVKAYAAVAEGGSSYNDLRTLIDDLVKARVAAAEATKQSQ
uniref:Glycosyltransferase n=1 Tax=Leersia perrieri TaxID=77586 RepID=A0A0D9WI99_9ORYZ